MVSFRKSLANAVRPFLTESGLRAARNLISLGFLTIFSQAINALVLILLARWWSPEVFGSYAALTAVQGYLLIIGNLGARPLAVREAVRESQNVDVMLTSFGVTTISGGFITFVITFVVAMMLPLSVQERQLLCILALGNVAACAHIQPFFDARHRQPLGTLPGLITETFAAAAIGILYASEGLTLSNAGIVLALKWLGVLLLQLVLYASIAGRIRWKYSRAAVISMLRGGIPLMLAWLIATVPLAGGVILVRSFGHPEDAAMVGLSQYVGQAFLLVVYIGLAIVQPHIHGQFGLSLSFVKKLAVFFSGYLGLLFVTFLIPTVVLLPALLGPAYHSIAIPATLFLAGSAIAGAANVLTAYAIALHAERLPMIAYGAGAMVFVIACLLLIPIWSYVGVGWSFVISQLVCFGLLMALCVRVWRRASA